MELTADEQKILEVVEAPEAILEAGLPQGDETSEMLARLYTELLGLLPHELAPVTPRPEVKQRILSAIPTGQTRVFLPTYGGEARGTILAWPREGMAPKAPTGETRARPARWPLALAATFLAALLGASALFYVLWSKQAKEIGRLHGEIAILAERAEQAEHRSGSSNVAEAHLRQREEQLEVVTSPQAAYCTLMPTAEGGLGDGVRGRLFVQADHQHWYLAVHGLPPAEAGKHYRLWFLDEKGQQFAAGNLEARNDRPAELASASMPAGTRHAVVTLETDPKAPRPAGPAVLRATPMQTL